LVGVYVLVGVLVVVGVNVLVASSAATNTVQPLCRLTVRPKVSRLTGIGLLADKYWNTKEFVAPASRS
jgi:hypothetical protein